MATTYPNSIDTILTLPTVPGVGVIPNAINALQSAVIAIETELGIKPSYPYSDVRSRLDILEARLARGTGGSGGGFDGYIVNPLNIINNFFGISTNISIGIGAPVENSPDGSLYLRKDGYTNEGLYSRRSGTWQLVSPSFTGDLSGSLLTQTVIGLQGRPINNATPIDGYGLVWSQADGYWKPGSVGIGGSASGDLSGTYPSPIVAKIQGRAVNSAAPTDGYTLVWSQTDGYWKSGQPKSVKGDNNTTVVSARNAANTADMQLVSTDASNDVLIGSTSSNTPDTFVQGQNRVFLGNSTQANAMLIGAGYEQHGMPILGGDGTVGVANSPFSAHGVATSNLGDSDQNITSAQYSKQRIELTDTWTTSRKRTFPTPANANSYYEKTIVNNTNGGFAATISCGAGTTVDVPNGNSYVLGFKSTGDVVLISIDYATRTQLFIAGASITKGQAIVSANDGYNLNKVLPATSANLSITGELLGIALASATTGSTVLVATRGSVVNSSIHLVTSQISSGNESHAIVNQTTGFVYSSFSKHASDYSLGMLSSDLSTLTIDPIRATGETSIYRVLDPKYGYNGLDRDATIVINDILRKSAQNSAVIEFDIQPTNIFDSQIRCRWDEIWIDKTDNNALDGIYRNEIWGLKFTSPSARSVGSYGLTIYDELNDFGNTTGDNNCGKQASIMEVSGGTVRVTIPQNDIWPKYATNTVYNIDDMIEPVIANDYVYRCFISGQTSGTASNAITWPTTVDATIQLGGAYFRTELKRPKYPIDPKEWEDHYLWLERANTYAHNARWLVVKVLKDGSDGYNVELLCAPNGSFSGVVVGNDGYNGTIAWRLMRSLFQVRQRFNIFENLTFYKKQGYYSSFQHYCTQGTYYGLAVITDNYWRNVIYDAYPVSSYKASYSMTAYEREVGNHTTTYRLRSVLANKAYGFPICPQPGHFYYRAEEETNVSAWAPGSYNVGDIVRPSTATGLWWECDRAGTASGSQPASFSSAGLGWGYSVDEGASKPRWHAVYSGATSSTAQIAWSAGASVSVGDIRRYTSQSGSTAQNTVVGGGYNLKCIQAGITGSTEPVPFANGKAIYTIYDVITDGSAKWRLVWNAGTGKLFVPFNIDYHRDHHVSAAQSKTFVLIDNGNGQSREHAWYDVNVGITDFAFAAGHQHVWGGGGRYTNEYAAYGGLIWHSGDAACSTRVILCIGNALYFDLRSLYAESCGGWLEVGGPGSTISIDKCRFTTDNSRLHRSRDFIATSNSGDMSITDTTIGCSTGTIRYCATQGDLGNTDPQRVYTRNFRTTALVDVGYPARNKASTAGPWRIANNSTLLLSNTMGVAGGYDLSSGTWTVNLYQIPTIAGNTSYNVGDLVVNPGAWISYQFRCITAGTTAVGNPSFGVSGIGQRFTSGGAAFISEFTTQPQNLLEWHAWEVAACINRDASFDFKVGYAYNVGDIIVPWEAWRQVQYRVTNVAVNTPFTAFGAEGTAPGRSGTTRPAFSTPTNQVIGATIVSGGITMVCEALAAPALWSYCDMGERIWIESRVINGYTDQKTEDPFINIGAITMGVTGGTANPTIGFGNGYTLYAPKEIDVLSRGLFMQQPSNNGGIARNPRILDINAFVYSDDNLGVPVKTINVFSVQQANGHDQEVDYSWLKPKQQTSTLISATRTALNNSGGTITFDGYSPYADWEFPSDFEWNNEFDVKLTLVSHSPTGGSAPTFVGPPLWTTSKYGITFVRATATGFGKTETWAFNLVRSKKGRSTSGTNGSVVSGGTTLTTSGNTLGTTKWIGGTLKITNGTSQGYYKIASTTNTTVVITGATFPATESSLSFTITDADVWTEALLANGAKVIGSYNNTDLSNLTTSAQWSSAGGVGWVNRAKGSNIPGTLYQNTGASAPAVTQDTDGIWYATFDGYKYIKNQAAITAVAQPLTYIFLLKFTSTDNAFQALADGYNTNCLIYVHPDIRAIYTNFGSLANTGVYAAGSDVDFWVLVQRIDNTRLSNPYRRTRFQQNNGAHNYLTADPGANTFDGLTIGANRSGTANVKAQICAIKVISGDLTKDDERRLTQAMMGVKGVNSTKW